MTIFKIWIIIFAFVSSQLAWNLRPFVGSRDLPFELFRARQSNFYVAVIQSVAGIFDPAQSSGKSDEQKPVSLQPDSTLNKTNGQQ